MRYTSRSKWAPAFALLIAVLLVSCGGGGGGGGTEAPVALQPMSDSFGRVVPEAGFAGGDSGASGGDGTAGDGAPIANAAVTIVDSAGRSVSGKTDAQGYFRLRIDGFVPPMIGNVVRPDGTRWYSPSLAAVKVRGFLTINMTGLTDYVASQVAVSAGKSGASELTPAVLAANVGAVQVAKNNLASQLTSQLLAAGLSPSTFDPVTLPFRPDLTGYDAVLENVIVVKSASGSTSLIPKYGLGGSIAGLGGGGLILSNGQTTLPIAAGATSFTFPIGLVAGAAYTVTVAQQPSIGTCAVSNGTGTMGTTPVTNVSVVCSTNTWSVGGAINSLGNRSGLALSLGSETLQVAANSTTFTFAAKVPQGGGYNVSVQSQPVGATCSVANGAGTVTASNVGSVVVTCSGNSSTLGGTISGLTGRGLTLASGGQTVVLPAAATTFTFATPVASGSNYAVTVQQQPTVQTCSVTNGSGTMGAGPVTSVSISCTAAGFTLGGTITGLNSGGLVLANGAQTVSPSSGASSFSFAAPLPSGTSYDVSVQAQPAGATCTVTNGTGSIGAAAVTSVSVACSANGDVAVYKYFGTVQCVVADGALALSQMQTQLVGAGVQVTSAACGRDGITRLAICGAPDGKIGVFGVQSRDASLATSLGFTPLSNLPNAVVPVTCDVPVSPPPTVSPGLG